MRLFADHCFFACGVDFLRKSGYDIIKASEAGLQKASDEEIIPFCGKENRIILPWIPILPVSTNFRWEAIKGLWYSGLIPLLRKPS